MHGKGLVTCTASCCCRVCTSCIRRCPHIMTRVHTLRYGHWTAMLLYDVSGIYMCRLRRLASSSQPAPRSSRTRVQGWRDSMCISDGWWCPVLSSSMSVSLPMPTLPPDSASSSASMCRTSCIRSLVQHHTFLCVCDRHMAGCWLHTSLIRPVPHMPVL